MTGLNHDFLVIETGSFSIDRYEKYSKSDFVEIHDSLLIYFSDSLSWISSYNPFKEEKTIGLCWCGVTIINFTNIERFKSIIIGWLQIFSEAPEIISLKGEWTWINEESPETGNYEELTYNKKDLLKKLSKLISYCDEIIESKGKKCLLHLGI